MRKIRLGVFSRQVSADEGGADVFFGMIGQKVSAALSLPNVEVVLVPWQDWNPTPGIIKTRWRRSAWRLGIRLGAFDLRPICQRLHLDIAYLVTPIHAKIEIPFIYTLWDLGHRTAPEFPEMRIRGAWEDREEQCIDMLTRAAYVIVGNCVGQREACSFYDLERKRVVPIQFPTPDFSTVVELVPDWLPQKPFFFYPAQFWAHKNHATLLRALSLLQQRGAEVPDLVFVGSEKGNFSYVKALAGTLGVSERVKFPGFVSSGELKALYRQASGLVFASMLGPNNLPPQEAAALGCPIILSDLPGHRAQMGESVHYACPLDPLAWAESMVKLMSEPDFRKHLVARARIQVENFTSENYLKKVRSIVEDMATLRGLWE